MSIPNRALADASAVTPKVSSARSNASSISKEEDRRLKLQQWKESKAMPDKRTGPSERKATLDKKAQFLEKRERRIQQEQEKKRASRSGKENQTPAMKPAADAHVWSKGTTTHTATVRRLSTTPNGRLAPEAQAQLTGTTPTSAIRRPQSRAKPLAAATPVSAPRSAASQPLDPSMNTSTPATAPAARIAICTTTGPTTPSRRSALSRPKASPYKERSHPTAPPTAAALRGADEQPGPSQPAVTGDRLSGQLARLSAGAAGERREGRVAVGGVVEAAARGRGAGAARRETFQDSRALTKSGLVVPGARSMARRASSAGPAGEELNGGGSRLLERRRLTSPKAPYLGGQPQETSTPATTSPSATQQLRVSSLSPNALAAKFQPHPTQSSPKDGAAPVKQTGCAPPAAAASAELLPAPLAVSGTIAASRVVRPAVFPEESPGRKVSAASIGRADGEDSSVLGTAGPGKQTETATPAPLAPDKEKAGPMQSPAPTTAPPEPPRVQVVVSAGLSAENVGVAPEVSNQAEREAEQEDGALLDHGQGKTTVQAAVATTGTGVELEQDARHVRGAQALSRPTPPAPSSVEMLAVSYNALASSAAENAEVSSCQSTSRAEAAEEARTDNARTAEAPTAAAVPLSAPAVIGEAPATATASSTAAAPAVTREDDARVLSTAACSTGEAMASEAKTEHRSPLFSRVSSLVLRRQDPLRAKMEEGRASGEVPAAAAAAAVRDTVSGSSPDGGTSSTRGSQGTEERPPTAVTTEVEEANDKGQGSPAASPPRRRSKLSSKASPEQGSRGTKGLLLTPVRGAAREGEVIGRIHAPHPGLTPPRARSGSSPAPTAERTTSRSPQEKRTAESTGQEAQKSTLKAGHARSALTPPGYRTRSSPLAVGRASPPRQQTPVTTRSAEETKGTSSAIAPRPAGATPPGYRSRSSLLPRGGRGSPQGQERNVSPTQGDKVAPGGSCGPYFSRLTPPGSRSGGPSLLTGRMSAERRDRPMVDGTRGSGSSGSPLRETAVAKLTPDRRSTGGPRETQGFGSSTPPLCRASSSSGVLDPTQQQQQRDVVGEAEKMHKRDVGCSPRALSDEGSTEDAVAPPRGSIPPAGDTLAAEPLLPVAVMDAEESCSPTGQQQSSTGAAEGEEARHEDETESRMTPVDSSSCPAGVVSVGCDSRAAIDASTTGRSRCTGVAGSPEAGASGTIRQERRCPGVDASAAVAADAAVTSGAAADEEKRGQKGLGKDAACSPTARPGCSSPEPKATSFPPTPRVVFPASGGLDGVGGDDCARGSTADGAATSASSRASPPSSPASAALTTPKAKAEGKEGPEGGDEPLSESEVLHCSPNFAAGFVAGRRKRRAVSGVPIGTVASSEGDNDGGGGERMLSRRSEPAANKTSGSDGHSEGILPEEDAGGGGSSGAESSGDESGSSWETCSSSEDEEEDEGCEVAEQEEGEGWEGLSYLDKMNNHPYGDEVVIDPDLVRSGSSSNGGGSSLVSSLRRSSFGESHTGEERRSWAAAGAPPDPVMVEMATQTGPGEEKMEDKMVQAGDGRLLTEVEVQDEYDLRELRERLEMMNHDLLAEVFHREIVKQEEAQKRRRMEKAHEEVLLLMEQEAAARELEHKNELVKMRWEHAEELRQVEEEAGDGVRFKLELEDERRLRAEDERRHEISQQKERQQRKEWEGRYDDVVRQKREEAKLHREETRACAKKAEAEKKRIEARHREEFKRAEGVVKMQLETIKEMDQENDELREENARLRERLGMEVEEEDEEGEDEEGEEGVEEEEEEEGEEGGGEEEEEEGEGEGGEGGEEG